jgi:hypothetical protein
LASDLLSRLFGDWAELCVHLVEQAPHPDVLQFDAESVVDKGRKASWAGHLPGLLHEGSIEAE